MTSRVVATAGHVDHGKSTLVRALTGMEPDRLAEERRRGLTVDLGFAWTRLPSGTDLAFVDVPGHERFVTTMLAGAGPVPAAVVVVAADEGWMRQSGEHLDALDALGVRHGLLVVTRCDLLEPGLARADAAAEIARSSLGEVPVVEVCAPTGQGLDALRDALDRLVAAVPEPDPGADVRLWVDRAFTIRGSGTVVTGTLGSGTLRVGDELEVGGRRVGVRGLQSLGEPVPEATGVARVAVNLRGVPREALGRGDALLTPGAWLGATEIDVAVHGVRGREPGPFPEQLMLHVGSAAVAVRVRPLGGAHARLRAEIPLPLRIGDRAVLRDPGRRAIAGGIEVLDVRPAALRRRGAAAARAELLAAVAPPHRHSGGSRGTAPESTVPPERHVGAPSAGERRSGRPRGTAAERACPPERHLGSPSATERRSGSPSVTPSLAPFGSAAGELSRRGIVKAADLVAMGVPRSEVDGLRAPFVNGWLLDPALLPGIRIALADGIRAHDDADPLDPGLTIEAARRLARLPDPGLLTAALTTAALTTAALSSLALSPPALSPAPPDTTAPDSTAPDSRAVDRRTPHGETPGDTGTTNPRFLIRDGRVHLDRTVALPSALTGALASLREALRENPFAAPDAERLTELGLGRRELATLVRAGELLAVGEGVVLLPDAPERAVGVLRGLRSEFTLSEARQALRTSRRVAVPLLELLARTGHTRRTGDSLHSLL
ncbi:hypothetical protein GCM10009836_27600 [Pseudonocardia ailaonensis]|uniref:Tr-type G domain-containing protein n=1 Tax=Pseudonocardia ailaonensis TaxID=367279 RepID=A0ABN2N0M6_9PSEU